MMKLRPYQNEAVQAVYDYFGEKAGNPLIVMPTGTGKSVVIADFVKGAVGQWPDTRIVIATHVKELVAQNFSKLIAMWPDAPVGIVSAGLNKREFHKRVVFASIQSIFRHAYTLQRVDLLLVDEAHMIPKEGEGMWRTFIDELLRINPTMKVVGYTATPFRLKGGNMTRGKGAIFTDVAYEVDLVRMIKEGYLAELVPPREDLKTRLDTTGVGKSGGEYKQGELERAVDKDYITNGAVSEIIKHGENRRSWLIFCSGVSHAHHVAEAIRSHGITCETVTGDTPDGERDRILNQYKTGQIRCVTNANVLTTGFDAPATDLIAALRPTASAGLWVQMLGRGMRPVYAAGMPLDTDEDRLAAITAGPKVNCLVLDFARNIDRHGPIDKIKAKDPKEGGGGEAPVKECPQCHAICHAAARHCPDCGYEFPPSEIAIEKTASDAAILSTQDMERWVGVDRWTFEEHHKVGSPTSLRVEYYCGPQAHREWVCLEHRGYARDKAVRWWHQHCITGEPCPQTVAGFLAMLEERTVSPLVQPSKIALKKNGKYYEIIKREFMK